ncbi:putative ribonuclease H-like domain-containing protein [Tanacetum coccineum]
MSGEEPATQIAPVESPQMVSTVKLPILKKGEYTLWIMRMEQYLSNTYYSLWQTAQALLQRQRERKAKSILLLAIPDEYQLRFHGIKDAKSLWAAIKSIDKAYDRFRKLISLLEVHGAAVPNEDANQKFLRALPSSWNNVALIMRNTDGIDDLDIDDLYNNLKVFEADIKGSSGSSSNSQNVAFFSAEDTSSNNEVNTANGVSTASGHNFQGQAFPSSYTDDLMFSFFANQSNSLQLDNKDLEQIDHDDLEEMDLKWQVDMLSMRVKRFYKKTGRKLIFNGKEPVGFDKTKDNALIVQDGLGYDWSYIAQDEPTEFALMAYTSNSSGSDTEVQSYSKNRVKTYEKLQNQFDEQRQTLSKANLEIIAYQLGLESVEAQLIVHQKNEVVYEEKIAVLEFEVKDKRLDDSVYRPTTNKTSASVSQVETSITPPSNNSVEMPRVESVRPISAVKGNGVTAIKALACCIWRPKMTDLNNVSKDNSGSWVSKRVNYIDPQGRLKHMTGNKDFLTDYQDIDGGFVAFGGGTKGGKITGKGKIRTDKLDFEDVFFVKELNFNLFYVSQMCDKKNNVLFTETECLVLSPDFKLLDETKLHARVPRQSNMYSFDLRYVVPSGDLTCLFAKATINESKLWHRRLGHVNIKTMNKLVKGNLKGKQHKASCKAKLMSSISQPLHMLHMDLFGPTSVRSINHKAYCLVVTDDFSRFSWVFFLASKDETSGILKRFITEIENQLNHKVKVIRCDNGREFKNREINEFCGLKGIKREFSVARTPQQNGVSERKNKTLIKAARTMLAYSLLPTVFWAEAVNTACYNVSTQQYIVFPLWSSISSSNKSSDEADEDDTADEAAGETPLQKPASENEQALKNVLDKMMDQEKEAKEQSDAVRKDTLVNTAGGSIIFGDVGSSFVPLIKFTNLPHDPLMPDLEDTTEVPNTSIFGSAYDDDDLYTCNSPYADQVVVAEADFNNMESSTIVSPIPTTRVHSIHPKDQIIGDLRSAVQTRGMTKKSSGEHAMISYIQKQRRSNHKDFQNCLLLLQFKIQKVWTLVDLPYDKKAIGTKWVYRNKKDKRGIIVRNKARLVPQGYKQEEGIDYDEVFAPVAKIKVIKLFLAHASFMNFLVYQMDVKSAFLYCTIEVEVYVSQPPGFVDLEFPEKVYKVEKALYGLHQAPKAWYDSPFFLLLYLSTGTMDSTKVNDKTLDFEKIMHKRFQMSSIGELTFFLGLQVKQEEDGIFISQDKYVGEILKKFGFSSIRTASTPMETNKALTKDEDGEDVDVHLYRSMIRLLMYLTSSRPDIMFLVCACSRFQVQPKVSHLNTVKRIFRYLKGRPNLGLWYPKDSPFILEAFSDSDYAGASLDRKSTTGGCQFLGSSALDPKSDVGLWIQFRQIKIHVDNESAICVVKNPVYHSKTKHIEIRHHFIRDSYEKRLIDMDKIHTDNNVADLLTKAFDGRLMVFKCSGVYASAIWIEVGMDYNYVERAITTAASLDAAHDNDNIIEDASKEEKGAVVIKDKAKVMQLLKMEIHENLEDAELAVRSWKKKVLWHLSLSSSSNQCLKSSKMFGYILLMTKMLKLKKLDD